MWSCPLAQGLLWGLLVGDLFPSRLGLWFIFVKQMGSQVKNPQQCLLWAASSYYRPGNLHQIHEGHSMVWVAGEGLASGRASPWARQFPEASWGYWAADPCSLLKQRLL